MKILIIEDEYNLADAIASMLKSKKYSVDIKTDGKEGLDEALTDIYDLIILDVMLPHMNGFEILKTLREEKINTKMQIFVYFPGKSFPTYPKKVGYHITSVL